MPCPAPKSPEPRGRSLPGTLFPALPFALSLVCAAPGLTDQLWSVHPFGLKVGELGVAMEEDENTYSGAGHFRTTGLVGVLARIRLDISGTGHKSDAVRTPLTYEGRIDTGRRKSRTELVFSEPVPRKVAGPDNPAVAIPNAALKGAIDPFTMMWLTIGDRSAPLCQFERSQFDGTRLVAIRLTERETDGDLVTCHGIYDRLGGYTPEELDEITQSPLSITYEPHAGSWRAVRVKLQSRHGPATLKRRD